MSPEAVVVWNGASRQLLCGGLERDYAAMHGAGWDLIYTPPSPMTTPWHGLSDRDLRRLYVDEWLRGQWARGSRIVTNCTGEPKHRHAAADGLLACLLTTAETADPCPLNTQQFTEAAQTAGRPGRNLRQHVRSELSRLVGDGRLRRICKDHYRVGKETR